ncbi:Protein CYSTEINE-RICH TRANSMEMBRANE MODULE 6 [Linum perenne]
MTQIDQQFAAAPASSAGSSYSYQLPKSSGSYVVEAPPPIGYPTRDGTTANAASVPIETKSKGDGFWKGCCAALCCCCMLDACF